ncbi:MAG: YtxH domain-containing protein [Chloroflexota bacterium]|nr:YtxH domain-containing protein [Chloroflexota bacterium]
MNFTMPWTANNGHHNGASDTLHDVRDALGREADHLAQVAAQMGRDAGGQADSVARDVARDAQKQTGAAISRIAEVAAAVAPTIAVMSRQKFRQVGEQAQSIGHELRQVRVTKEPRRSGQGARPGIALIGGLGIGVALMYLLDPERGKQRREALMAKLAQWTRDGRQAAATKVSELSDRTAGVISDVRESVNTGSVVDEGAATPVETTIPESWPQEARVPIS